MRIPVLNIFGTDTSIKAVKTLTFKPRNSLDVWTWEHIEEWCDQLQEKGVVSCWPVGFVFFFFSLCKLCLTYEMLIVYFGFFNKESVIVVVCVDQFCAYEVEHNLQDCQMLRQPKVEAAL